LAVPYLLHLLDGLLVHTPQYISPRFLKLLLFKACSQL
jgi:hypothetical protein